MRVGGGRKEMGFQGSTLTLTIEARGDDELDRYLSLV